MAASEKLCPQNGSSLDNDDDDNYGPDFCDTSSPMIQCDGGKLRAVSGDSGSGSVVVVVKRDGVKRWEGNYLLNLYTLIYFVTSVMVIGTHCLIINVRSAKDSHRLAQARSLSNRNINDTTNPESGDPSRLVKRAAGIRDSLMSAKLQEVDALAYLQRYGYLNGTAANANLISEDSFQEAIMNFQRFAGIPETGSIDGLTVKYMQTPRCGNKDRSGKGENGKRRRRRRKRYALQGSKWRRQELTYRISQYPTRFLYKKEQVDGQIEKAFRIWSQVAPIDFVVKREGRVHIDIRFASGEHGDGDPFDGPGNTLAHAYFPQYGGDAHFDDQEYWTVDSYAGTNIFQVAAHELGHSLGLGHSSVREALMAPFYQKYKPNFKLHADDILGIQALYGERSDLGPAYPSSTSTSTTSTSTTTSTENPRRAGRPTGSDPGDDDGGGSSFFGFGGGSKPVDLCQDPAVDAITRTEDGNTYVFRGQHYWQIKNEGLASGYPAKISRDWDGLPGNLDAALTWSDGKTFFFKGDKYWRFFNKRREPGYPKLISAGFAGIPNNVDAAFVWSGNGKTYFFKKDKYWRFDSKQEPPVSSQYPKSIKNWVGLPTSGIDAAFKWENGMTYFFKDDLYYRFDDREFEVDSTSRPSFPRSISEWWYGCTNSNLPIRKKSDELGADELLEPEATSDEASRSSTGSVLVFHRKPNQPYDQTDGSTATRPRPSGNSISRSIFASLSSLFPSSSGSSPPSPATSSLSGGSQDSDWSFHRGVGEEMRRFHKSSRSVPDPADDRTVELGGIRRHRFNHHIPPAPDNTRWSFPIAPIGSSSREQSLSELRMDPNDKDTCSDPNEHNSSQDHSNQQTAPTSSSSAPEALR